MEDLWPYCFRVSVEDAEEPNFTYEYMGDELKKLYGSDMTGLTITHNMRGFIGAVIHKKIQEVTQSLAPAQDEGFFVNGKGQLIKYRSCVLPFGNQQKLTHIIVGLSYRQF